MFWREGVRDLVPYLKLSCHHGTLDNWPPLPEVGTLPKYVFCTHSNLPENSFIHSMCRCLLSPSMCIIAIGWVGGWVASIALSSTRRIQCMPIGGRPAHRAGPGLAGQARPTGLANNENLQKWIPMLCQMLARFRLAGRTPPGIMGAILKIISILS